MKNVNGKEALQALIDGKCVSFSSDCGSHVGLAQYLSVYEILNEKSDIYKNPKPIKFTINE